MNVQVLFGPILAKIRALKKHRQASSTLEYRCVCGTEYELGLELAGCSVQCAQCGALGVAPFAESGEPTVVASAFDAAPASALPETAAETAALPHGDLTPVGALLKKSWNAYKGKALILAGLAVTPWLLLALPMGLAMGVGVLFSKAAGLKSAPIAICAFVGALAAWYGTFWGQSAVVRAVVVPGIGFKESLRDSRAQTLSFFWLSLLMGTILVGAYLLFVVPGAVLNVAFWFAFFILIAENETGLNALLRSMAYVRGRGVRVAGRIALVLLGSAAINLIPVAGPLLYFFVVTPFLLVYTFQIYLELKASKPGLAIESPGKAKRTIVAVGLAGYVLPVVALFVMGASLKRFLPKVGPQVVPLLMAKAENAAMQDPALRTALTEGTPAAEPVVIPPPSAAKAPPPPAPAPAPAPSVKKEAAQPAAPKAQRGIAPVLRIIAVTSDGTRFKGTLLENDGYLIGIRTVRGENAYLPISELISINGQKPRAFLKRHAPPAKPS